jgi:hypothetical protein
MKSFYNLIKLLVVLFLTILPQHTFSQTTCVAPTGVLVSNNTQNSVILSWTTPNTTTLYNVQYQQYGTANWVTLSNVTSPLTITGLNCGSVYVCQIQQICSSTGTPTVSNWSTSVTFQTMSCNTTCNPPTGMTTTSISQTGAVLNWTPTSTTTNQLYNIQYHDLATSTWTIVNNVTMPYQLGNLTCGTGYVWQVQQVCSINTGTTPVVSAWTTGTTFSTLACTTTCNAPTGMTTTSISQTGAVLNWTPTSTTTNQLYNIQYHSTATSTWTTVNNVTMPYQLGNLTCGTGYVWQVQQICSNATGSTPVVSPWTTGTTFSTLACTTTCNAPTGMTTTNISQTGAVLNCTSTSATTLYNIQYHNATTSTWTIVNNVTMPYQLGNLTCGTGYVWQIQQVCSSSTGATPVVSSWTTGTTFSTLACTTTCNTPTGMTTTNISQTGAVLNCTSTSATALYNIQYHSTNSTAWTTVNNVTMPYTLTGLTCGTGYVWQVQQICSINTGTTPVVSAWTTGTTFSTLACTTICTTPTGMTTTSISQTGAVLNWTPTSTTTNQLYNIQYHSVNSTSWTTVNNVTMPYTLTGLTCGTGYVWQVQQVCSINTGTTPVVSAWTTGTTFSTLACTTTCNAPTGMTTTNISQTGAVLNCTSTSATALYNIQYHSANSTAWTIIYNVTMPYTLTGLTCGTGYVWQVQQVCSINTGATPIVSAWTTGTTFSTLACTTTCNAPTGMTTTNISQTGAVLNWTPTSTTTNQLYNIQYHSTATSTWTTVNNVTMPYTLTGLTCGTGYVWQVQQVCSINTGTTPVVSAWTTGTTFSTLACTTTCNAPTGMTTTNISQTGAVLNWTPTSTTTNQLYNIQYHSANSTAWTTVNNVTMPYTLTGLTCGTGYIWQVQQVCSNTAGTTPVVSVWTTGTTFSTLACTVTCNAPTGMTTTNISQTGAVLNCASTSATALYNIQYHSTATSTWTIVNNVTMPYQLGNLTCGTGYVWQVQQVCSINTGTTPVVSAWTTGTTFSTLACTTTCNAPTGMTTTSISQTGAVLNCTSTSATALYNIQYHSTNSTAWTTVNNVTMPYTLTGLTCGTGYVWQVQQICSINTGTTPVVSAWTTGTTFSTLACTTICTTPTGMTTTSISQTGAVLNWTPTSTTTNQLYNIQYHSVNSTSWTTVNNVTMPYTLTGLTCGTGYVWQVQQVCSINTGTTPVVSAWTTGTTFSTLACTTTCNAPTGMTTTNISQTGAVLNCTSTSATALYNIQYHSANSTAWTIIYNVTMPYTLTGLTCGTGYVWQVQQVCSINTGATPIVSAWTTGTTFSTLACTTTCNAPTGMTTTNISQTGAVLNWTPTSTTTNQLYNIQYHSTATSTWTTVNNVTMPYTLTGLTCGTGYVWQVQQVCSINTGTTPVVSAWTTGTTFSTLACTTTCNAPTGMTTTNISQTGAVLNWTPTSTTTNQLYNIQYHSANSTAWTTVNNVTMPYTLTGLTCGTGYIWQVQQVCSNTAGTTPVVSVWTTGTTFSTLACTVTCNAPTGMTTTNISQTGAVLNCASTSATALYNIQYHSTATSTWTIVNNVTMPYQLGNLTCGTGYVWQVQQVCSINTGTTPVVSAWTTGTTFSTLACTTTCNAPTGMTTTSISQTGAVLNWYSNSTSANQLYNIQYHSANSTAWTIIHNVTMPYQLGNLTCGTGYVWQVQQICSINTGTTSVVSPWTTGTTFSTLACTTTCNAPTGMTTTNISQTGAVLNCNPNSTSTNQLYNIQYHSANSTAWTIIHNVTMPYQLGELNLRNRICLASTTNLQYKYWNNVSRKSLDNWNNFQYIGLLASSNFLWNSYRINNN